MAEQQFQIMLTNQDYTALRNCGFQNQALQAQVTALQAQTAALTKTLYLRDAFIQYMTNQFDYTLSLMLHEQILHSDISQSVYQNVVEHEQKGTSAMEVREAMEVMVGARRGLWEKLAKLGDRVRELEATSEGKEGKGKEEKGMEELEMAMNAIVGKSKQIDEVTDSLATAEQQLQALSTKCQKLDQENQALRTRCLAMQKQLQRQKSQQAQSQNKKQSLPNQGEKSYLIKLMVDEYYRQLEMNMVKMGGLTSVEIGTVVSNQMKGIVEYITGLAKKAKKY